MHPTGRSPLGTTEGAGPLSCGVCGYPLEETVARRLLELRGVAGHTGTARMRNRLGMVLAYRISCDADREGGTMTLARVDVDLDEGVRGDEVIDVSDSRAGFSIDVPSHLTEQFGLHEEQAPRIHCRSLKPHASRVGGHRVRLLYNVRSRS